MGRRLTHNGANLPYFFLVQLSHGLRNPWLASDGCLTNDPDCVFGFCRVHDVCFGETGLNPGQKLPRSNWTCCHGAQVCDVPVHLPAEYYEDNWVGQKGLEMLLQRPQGKPWYMQVNWPGPHTPFIVTEEMMSSTATRAFDPPVDYFFGPNSVDDNIVARRL